MEAFRALREASGGLPAVIHASYLVNLGAEGELWEKSVASLADDLEKAALLGVERGRQAYHCPLCGRWHLTSR